MSLGMHIGRSGSKDLEESALEVFNKFNWMGCFQIFTHGPKTKTLNKIPHDKLIELGKTKNLYVHSSYSITWSDSNIECFRSEFKTADQIGAKGIVLHIPIMKPEDVCDWVVKFLSLKPKTLLLLEMCAVKVREFESYESPEKLIRLIQLLESKNIGSDKVQLCIDTAHIFSGFQSITSGENVKEWLSKLLIKKDWIGLLHMNGNARHPAVNVKDKHTVPFSSDDQIWNKTPFFQSGFVEFLRFFLQTLKKDVIFEIDYNALSIEFFQLIEKVMSKIIV